MIVINNKRRLIMKKFLNDQNRGDMLSQRDIDNTYRQGAFDWNVKTDERDYNRNVYTDNRNYNYGVGQDSIRNNIMGESRVVAK